MWNSFITWLKGLFQSPVAQEIKKNVVEFDDDVYDEFKGWIKDAQDPRDQIFTGKK